MRDLKSTNDASDEFFVHMDGMKSTKASKPKHIVAGLAYALLAAMITFPIVFFVATGCEWAFGRAAGSVIGLYALGYLALKLVPAYINLVHERLGISVRV